MSELEKGSYIPKRNNIKVIIDDTLHRTSASGGLVEIDEKRFGLADVKPGNEVTVEFCYPSGTDRPIQGFLSAKRSRKVKNTATSAGYQREN